MASSVSYGNGNILRPFEAIDIKLDAGGAYTLPYLDVSDFGAFYATVHNVNSALDITFRYSVDGTTTSIKSFDEVVNTLASTTTVDLGTRKVKTRYLSVIFNGTPFSSVVFQMVFRVDPPGDSNVENVGGFTEIYVDGTSSDLRTLQSSDTSVTITQNADNIDLTIGAVPSTIWQQVGAQITPVTVTQTSIHAGLTNSISPIAISSFCFGESNVLQASAVNTFFHGNSNTMTSNNQQYGAYESSGTFASQGCTMEISGGLTPCYRSAIIASFNSELEGDGGSGRGVCQSVVMASEQCYGGGQLPNPRKVNNSSIISCFNCELGGYSDQGINQSGIMCSSNSFIGTTSPATGRENKNSCIVAGESHNLGSSNSPRSNNVIVGGTTSQVDGTADNNIIIGSNCLINGHNGNVQISDSFGGTGLTSAIDHRYTSRFINGYQMYTNSLNTTGAQMLGGASSWSSVSTRDLKENIEEIRYNVILDKVDKIPIFKYNYIGNDPQQRNISPMAEDWHTEFKFIDGGSKSDKVIESMDAIGICLASIKGLKAEIDHIKVGSISSDYSDADKVAILEFRVFEMELQVRKLIERLNIVEDKNKDMMNKLEQRINNLELQH